VRTIVFCALLGVAATVHAQSLPSEPIAIAGGHVVIGGELTATAGPEDPGFFNYTDYEYNALRNLRIGVTTEVRAHARLQFLSEIHIDRGDPFNAFALYARIRPWPSRRLDIQVGRVPPTFGAFGRGGYSTGNILIGYPLGYQYLTSLRSDAMPATAEELWRMRGRGWRSSFELGNPTPGPGLPLVNAFHRDIGVQVHGIKGPIEWTGAVTTGSLSNPGVDDHNGSQQIAGRVVLHATPGLAIGFSGARGAFLSGNLQPSLTPGAEVSSGVQRGVGVDAEYSAGRFLGRGEVVWSRWALPLPFTAGALHATALRGEARYRVIPGVHLAGRIEHLGFNKLTSGSRIERWEAPVTRLELGAGWSIVRNLMLKGSWQRNHRDAGRVRHDSLGAAQVVYWF
jgi:hypothetical protein